MNESEKKEFSDRVAYMLLSHANHSLSISALGGMGEITLRDGLVVASAAQAASKNYSWVVDREFEPSEWKDGAIDIVISKISRGSRTKVGSIELKLWRQNDSGNASNRRRDLVRDIIRSASFYKNVDFSFFVLLSTSASWEATFPGDGVDDEIRVMLESTSKDEKWNIRDLSSKNCIKNSLESLNKNKVEISSHFSTRLLSNLSTNNNDKTVVFTKVWSIKKTRNSRNFDATELSKLTLKKPRKSKK